MAAAEDVGQWGPLFDLENVAAHASLLPNGKVLYWGRRSNPKDTKPESLNEHFTKAFIWDPSTGKSKATASQPLGTKAETVNLFCSGHCFQPDGSLLIVGGHISDGNGLDQACVYDPVADTWSAKAPMNAGRWYPSALTLPDGRVLSISGNTTNNSAPNPNPQIWGTDNWVPVASPGAGVLSLYPRLHLDPKGRVFMAGPQARSRFLDVNTPGGIGAWTTDGPERRAGGREYAPSVMYDKGKIMYIGGGGGDSDPPTKMTEIIDLIAETPKWTTTADLRFARRQHNATVLPDGTVLVTGGTQGKGFNNLETGMPVHVPELWNPVSKQWTQMAKEDADRCYHSIALLLPDGQVLSAGSGEFAIGSNPNAAKDSLKSAQLFRPPYLFNDKGPAPRPTISNPPPEISYGQKFEVTVGANDVIARVSWVRLGSVTHACNMNQLLIFLDFQQEGSKVAVQAPANANLAPPGHYMLFVLNQQGVPSVAPIIRIKPASTPAPPTSAAVLARRTAVEQHVEINIPALNEKIISEQERQERPAVVVGLTPVCPYGLGPCWGGAFEALQHIRDVEVVRPMPNQVDSVAFVYLRQDILPDIDLWRSEFQKIASGAYDMRGIEMTLSGVVTKKQLDTGEQLTLASTSTRPELVLEPFQATSKIEWDRAAKAPKPRSNVEADAYAQLSAAVAEHPGVAVQVSGRLQKHGANKFLEVREFEVVNAAAAASS